MLLSASSAALAQETVAGTVSGRVVNDTRGGTGVSGAEVTLITYIDGVLAETSTVEADLDGEFRFEGIDPENTYLVSVRYLEVDYYHPVVFEPGKADAYVEARVCDTTGDDANIKTGLARYMISIEEDSLLVTAFYWMVNDGDRTYTGGEKVLVFTLPDGAYGFEAPEALLPDYRLLEGNRVAYLVPFPPGERQLAFVFRLAKPSTGEFTVPLMVDYPADVFEVLVAGDDIEVAADRLAPVEPFIGDEGERFIRFSGEDLPRGTVVNVYLTDTSGGSGFPLAVVWVIIAVAAVIVVAVYVAKRKSGAGSGE
jgi:hypothetical protein